LCVPVSVALEDKELKMKKETPKKPYFTRFLEPQDLAKVQGARPPFHTLRYPSDDDEGVPL
jgi:hypothetical protein